MEHQLTHKILHRLQMEGYTILVAENQGENDSYTYTPVDWDVDAFLNETMTTNFDQHAIDIIDELLKIDEKLLSQHTVIINDQY